MVVLIAVETAARRSTHWLSTLLTGTALAAGAVAACSGESELPGYSGNGSFGGAGGTTGPGMDAGPCEHGEVRDCHVKIGEREGIVTCYVGKQACSDGMWGPCTDGMMTNKPGVGTESDGGMNTQSLSEPTICKNNPCDPYCKIFEEAPEAGIRADAGNPIYTWPTGSLADYPSGLVSKGLKEPCKSGLDCQFNMQCTNVATASSCAHSKCVVGSALDSTCDPCVQQICAADASCCGGSACAHDVCATGEKLSSSCSTCVQAVCAAMPSCCTTSWNAACVAQVATSCPSTPCGCGSGELAYGGRCYRNESTDMDWDTARGVCAARGAGWDLVSIGSAGENDFVKTNVSAADTWIGFSDETQENNWAWSNLDPVTFTSWDATEPDNNGDEDCVRFDRTTSRWADYACSNSLDSLCERPATSVAGCSAGETAYGGRCYYLQTSNASYSSAVSQCAARGTAWNLVDISSSAENTFVQSLVRSSNGTWIGFSDAAAEGTFAWGSGAGVTYTNWFTQPDNSGNQDCVEFDDASGKWDDYGCGTNRRAVCEAPQNAQVPGCAAGEVSYGGRCYYVNTSNQNYNDAESACVSRGTGWHLADITSAADNTFIQTLTSGGSWYWVGLDDTAAEGTFRWKTTGNVPSYTNWDGEPNGAGGASEDCARYDRASGKWYDELCTNTYDSVCEVAQGTSCGSDSLVNGRCYWVNSSTETWTNAESDCTNHGTGWQLADILNAADNTSVVGLLASGTNAWIGLNDRTTEATYRWSVAPSTAVTYFNWAAGFTDTGSDDCAYIEQATGRWNDGSCSTPRRSVCEGACPAGTRPFGTSCYALETTNRTWSSASSTCSARGTGWRLARVDSAAENAFLQTFTSSSNTWIGYNDVTTEGTFVWDGGGGSSYTNWYTQPDDSGGQDCVRFSDTTGKWDDSGCTSSSPSICVGPQSVPPACTTGTANGTSCYSVLTSTDDWSTSRANCQALGTGFDLVTINDATENAFVATQTSGSDLYWIGLSDQTTEGSFAWSSGSSSTYRNWSGQPDGAGGATEDCTRFDLGSGKWYDETCATTYDFLCEGPETLQSGCPSYATEVNGSCYYLETSNKSWTSARDGCIALGTGWQLASVDSATENAVVGGMVASSIGTWIGLNDRTTEGTWVWQNGSTLGYLNWLGEPSGGSGENCGNFRQSSGNWRDGSCNINQNSFCEGPMKSTGASGGWTQQCVDRVATTCDAKCGAGNPPAATGTCDPWLPSEKDLTCDGADLALGVPCGNGTIPVCNHGTVAAPAGVRVVHFVGNSTQMPTCSPDLQKVKGECFTTKPVPPGECIDVECPSIGNLEEVMANPAGTAHKPECSCQDNWSIFKSNVTCGKPQCSGATTQASFKKVNMYVMFDRSLSMLGSKWNGSTDALKTFFQSASSSGLGIALEFFPLSSGGTRGDGCADTSSTTYTATGCNAALCANPMVALGTLTTAAAPTDTQEQALVNAVNGVAPGGWTPSWSALKGSYDWATAHQAANQNEITVVVFITDGEPTMCLYGGSSASTNTELANMAESAYASSGIRTYTISMQGANTSALDAIAVKGGTGQAFVIGNSNQQQVAADLTTALQAIAGQNASCDFPLPNQGLFDPSQATITYTPGSGSATTLPKQPASASCGSGWYFDDNATPTTINLCPSTCATVQADNAAKVDIYLGCPALAQTTVFTQKYFGDCPPATGPIWQYLAYEVTRPGDSAVKFRARVARTEQELAMATYKDIVTAPSSPDVCPMSGPAPCPADIYKALGMFDAKRPWLELEITVTPSSDNKQTPVVKDWEVTYSCPPNQ